MTRNLGSPKIRKTYAFLAQAEKNAEVFTFEEFVGGSGWASHTARANLTKKLSQHVFRSDGGYRAVGVKDLTEEDFCRLCSQNTTIAADPRRPRLYPKVEELIVKAREAALAAVQHYNNPTAVFRSGNYIVLMVIAFTAMFHAIFERDGIDFTVYDDRGNPKLLSGERMLWDLVKSAQYYADHCGAKYSTGFLKAMAKNLEFIIPLRHKIEHRALPVLDADLGSHCQAMLMNFETVLTGEFTAYHSLNTSLVLALQFSTQRASSTVDALRRFHSEEYSALKQYISDFEAGLPDEIIGNSAYAFRVYLIPKTAIDARRSDISIEFVKIDPNDPEQASELARLVVAIKDKDVVGDPSKFCTLWESEVVASLQSRLGEIQYGAGNHTITGSIVRDIVFAHNIPTPSRKYFRPNKQGARAQYGQELIDWICEEYIKDQDFFYKAHHVVYGPTVK